MRISALPCFRCPSTWNCDDETFDQQLAEVDESLELFKELGCSRCEKLISPASSSLPYHENFERHRQRIGTIAETLAKGEMQLGLGLQAAASHREGAEFQFIHNADDLLTLINTTGADNVGLALDTWNWQVGGGAVDQLRELKGDQIVSVKLSDIPGKRRSGNDHRRSTFIARLRMELSIARRYCTSWLKAALTVRSV